jgi:hypothetical protein
MSGLRAGHVWEMPLKPSLEAGYAWLTQDKAKRPDISGLGAKHVQVRSLELGLGRGVGYVCPGGRTCSARVSGIRLGGGICLVCQEFLVVG